MNSRGAKLKKYTIVYNSRYYIIKPPCKYTIISGAYTKIH